MKKCLRANIWGMVAVTVILGACGSPGAKTDSPAGPRKVEINGFSFKPANLEVKAGSTVRWVQMDATKHSVTSGEAGPIDPTTSRADNAKPDGTFDSPDLAKGEDFEYTFAEAGTFDYFCQIHPEGMRGQITVTP